MRFFRRLSWGLALFVSSVALDAAPPTLSFNVSGGQLTLAWPQSAPGYQVESVPTLDGSMDWQPTTALTALSNGFYTVTLPAPIVSSFYRLGPAPLTSVSLTSPANGEVGVSVLRPTILQFSTPLATNTLITPDQFFAETSAGPLLTRIEFSSDRLSASLFYLEPLPAGGQVTVTFDATGIYDQDGRPLDAEGDGEPDGVRVINFENGPTQTIYNSGDERAVATSGNLTIREGGRSIGYSAEDPYVRDYFEGQLGKDGLKSEMPEELYKND